MIETVKTETLLDVPSNMEKAFTKFINKMNRKASKAGVDHLDVENLGKSVKEQTATYEDSGESTFPVEVITFKITGEFPKFSGWEFCASVEVTENGNLLHKSPYCDAVIPEKYKTIGAVCEHCNHNRQRKNIFILFNQKKNEFIQVGTACIKDFLGGHSFDAFRFQENLYVEFSNFEESMKSAPRIDMWPVDYVLSIAHTVVARYGYVKSSNYDDYEDKLTTATQVKTCLQKDYFSNKHAVFTKQDFENNLEKAKETIEFANTLDTHASDYNHNLSVIIKNGYCGYRNIGLVASLVAYEYAKKNSNRQNEELKSSDFVGKVGDKLEKVVKVKKVTEFEGQFGWSTSIFMVGEDGNVYTGFWNKIPDEVEQGVTVKIKFTVKNHRTFKDVKQTQINRIKLLQVVDNQ